MADADLSGRFLGTREYPDVVRRAIMRMGSLASTKFSGELLVSGLVVRHLVLPGLLGSTRKVLEWFRDNLGQRALLSVMFQYTPVAGCNPGRGIERHEYETVLEWLEEFEIDRGFVQEPVFDKGVATGDDWLPDFRRPNPFSSELSIPVWHYSGSRSPILARLTKADIMAHNTCCAGLPQRFPSS